jgi:hypothetical protein
MVHSLSSVCAGQLERRIGDHSRLEEDVVVVVVGDLDDLLVRTTLRLAFDSTLGDRDLDRERLCLDDDDDDDDVALVAALCISS